MAYKGYDPHDIRSEMGASSGVAPSATTPPSATPAVENLDLVAVAFDAVPLVSIPPGGPGNEIDVENPPDFDVLNRYNPQPPMPRRSKRQAGFDPDFELSKKPRVVGSSNLLDTDFSSGDDSGDDDFELVQRPKSSVATKGSVQSVTGETLKSHNKQPEPSGTNDSSEDEQSLAEFLAQLKREKAARPTSSASDEPDEEMQQEFKDNRPGQSSDDSSSESESESESDFESETHVEAVETDSSEGDEAEEISGAAGSNASTDVATGVANTDSNIDTVAFDLHVALSSTFYSEATMGLRPLFVNRGFIEELNIDVDAFAKQNLINFFKDRKLLSTITSASAYCRKPVLEFYVNLFSSVGDARSAKFGQAYVRNGLYSFNPLVINTFYGTPAGEESQDTPDIHEMTAMITGGLVKTFPDSPARLSASNLTSFYSVLHKLAVRNRTPSSNSTSVTRPQVPVLYSIGTGSPSFDFGRLVFSTVMQFAEGGFKSTKLPYPSLIYAILESQGFVADDEDELSLVEDTFKIAAACFKGNRKKDLPWSASGVVPDVANTAPSSGVKTATASSSGDYVLLAPSHLRAQIAFGRQQIANAQQVIAHYENLVADYELLLDVAVHSGQKGGVGSTSATATSANIEADDPATTAASANIDADGPAEIHEAVNEYPDIGDGAVAP